MSSTAMVELALDLLSCNQKELATRLGVSPTQISKWKKGDYISLDMDSRFRNLMGIGDQEPEFILRAGGKLAAEKWERLISFIAKSARENAETVYETYPLTDEQGLLCWHTFHTLVQMGVEIPKEFPVELDLAFEDAELEWEPEEHPLSSLIEKIFLSLNHVYAFYTAYIADYMDDEKLDLMETSACEIEPCLMELAACKLEVDESIAKNFNQYRHRVFSDYKKWLDELRDCLFRAGLPLRAELLDLVYKDIEDLSYAAEAESLGFNKARLHPDIYMNELLVGMRAIHQVLPVIMEKLGIDESEFAFDQSDFHL